MLEVDANPNPLRSLTCGSLGRVDEGFAKLTGDAGLGLSMDLAALRGYAVKH